MKKDNDCPYCNTDIGEFTPEHLDNYANHLLDKHRNEVFQFLKEWLLYDLHNAVGILTLKGERKNV